MPTQLEDRYIVIPRDRLDLLPSHTKAALEPFLGALGEASDKTGKEGIDEVQRLKDQVAEMNTALEEIVKAAVPQLRADCMSLEDKKQITLRVLWEGTEPGNAKVTEPRSAYDRLVVQRETGESLYLDVYEILDAFRTESAALDHVVKKALAPGQRGHKDRMTDLREIEWSAKLARQQEEAALGSLAPEARMAKPDSDFDHEFQKPTNQRREGRPEELARAILETRGAEAEMSREDAEKIVAEWRARNGYAQLREDEDGDK